MGQASFLGVARIKGLGPQLFIVFTLALQPLTPDPQPNSIRMPLPILSYGTRRSGVISVMELRRNFT